MLTDLERSKDGKAALMTIYRSEEWEGSGRQNFFWNEYRLKGEVVSQYKCNRCRLFSEDENEWLRDEDFVDCWHLHDEDFPGWLRKHL